MKHLHSTARHLSMTTKHFKIATASINALSERFSLTEDDFGYLTLNQISQEGDKTSELVEFSPHSDAIGFTPSTTGTIYTYHEAFCSRSSRGDMNGLNHERVLSSPRDNDKKTLARHKLFMSFESIDSAIQKQFGMDDTTLYIFTDGIRFEFYYLHHHIATVKLHPKTSVET